jgi:pimeloyl-ACP methyl ester carboxylesterase
MRRSLWVAALLLLLPLGWIITAPARASVVPVFEAGACDLPNAAALAPRLRCGTVQVPRNHAHPDAGSYALAVVVVASAQQPSLPDPVVYISGGPGAPLTVYAVPQAQTPYATGRDLILIDQRGTGRSEPGLCPDLNRKLIDATLALLDDDSPDAFARRQAVYSACRAEATGRGIDMADFGTTVTAADFDWVRRALGVERWNVYGESYGTTVAMTLAAQHPETIRSLVLDSIYPPDPVPLWSTRVGDSRDAFFAYCAQDTACTRSFPDLAQLYRAALGRLAETPLVVAVPTSMRLPDDRVRITAALFEALVSRLLYFPSAYPTLPGVIRSIHDGDTRGLEALLTAQLAALATQNVALHAAVECRDRPRFRVPLPTGASMLDRTQLYGICESWSALGPPPLIPAGTTIPTLLLAGQFDPVARPQSSRHLADTIGSSARRLEFPGIGHNVRRYSPCAAGITAKFIDHPAQPPDTSCVGQNASIRFISKQ